MSSSSSFTKTFNLVCKCPSSFTAPTETDNGALLLVINGCIATTQKTGTSARSRGSYNNQAIDSKALIQAKAPIEVDWKLPFDDEEDDDDDDDDEVAVVVVVVVDDDWYWIVDWFECDEETVNEIISNKICHCSKLK